MSKSRKSETPFGVRQVRHDPREPRLRRSPSFANNPYSRTTYFMVAALAVLCAASIASAMTLRTSQPLVKGSTVQESEEKAGEEKQAKESSDAVQEEKSSEQQSAEKDEKKWDKEKAFKDFEKLMTGAKLIGNFTVTGEKKDLTPEEYHIISAKKYRDGDYWIFKARIKYKDKDSTLLFPIRVEWAGGTPIITLDESEAKPFGKFTARVVIHNNKYAGTWSGGNHGGHLFGVIEAAKEDAKKKSADDEKGDEKGDEKDDKKDDEKTKSDRDA